MSFVHRIKQKYFPTLAEQLGYSDKDILVIVNIDDIGMHKDETEASFRALNFGMVKSGSVMVPCPNFGQVIKLWKENPEIDLGIHFTLNMRMGRKISLDTGSLQNAMFQVYIIPKELCGQMYQSFYNMQKEEILRWNWRRR